MPRVTADGFAVQSEMAGDAPDRPSSYGQLNIGVPSLYVEHVGHDGIGYA
jgi:hypothetical protein